MKFSRTINMFGPLKGPIRRYAIKRKLRFPKLISLELTNACNARCIMCPREQLTRKIGTMNTEIVEKVCRDSFKKPLKKMNLFGFGESLLYPRLVEVAKYIKQTLPYVELNLSTNAQLLNNGIADGLLRSGIDRINIDIDGAAKSTYEAVRKQLDYDVVVNNVKEFIKKRNQDNSKTKLSVTMIDMDITHNEIKSFKKMWTGLADEIFLNNYNTWAGTFTDRNINNQQLARPSFPCKNLWREMTINYNGKVSFCCMDFNSTIIIGDVTKQSIEEIWHGEIIGKLRKLHLEGKSNEIPLCRNCNEYVFQSDSFWANLFVEQ